MKKVGKLLITTIVPAASIPLIIWLLIRLTPLPPIGEMEYAREVLSNATRNKAETYSKKYYKEAKAYYDSAMANWRRENSRFLYFRDYYRVSMFAELSLKKAGMAAENSKNSSSDIEITVKQKIESLNSLVTDINNLFKSYPLNPEIINRISKGKFLLKEAEILFQKGQYLQSYRKITDSEYLLAGSYENSLTDLKAYFQSYSLWEKWVDTTINKSKENRDYSIIIDKFSRKCYVYLNGEKKHEFDAELGKNWVGDKRVKGDNATPEGMYKVTNKFGSNKTKYHKALLIDYPNDEDLEKFRKEITRGTLPASAKIGGLIEIHGNGGKGLDWTEGCVALTDSEMDLIFKIAKVGTPVTIVGSTIDLQQALNR